MEYHFHVAQDFSRCPGGRFKKDGPFSAEQLREDYIRPMLTKALSSQGVLVVWLDDVAGYSAAFLEEVFGNFSWSDDNFVEIMRIDAVSDRYRHYVALARTYLRRNSIRPDLK